VCWKKKKLAVLLRKKLSELALLLKQLHDNALRRVREHALR